LLSPVKKIPPCVDMVCPHEKKRGKNGRQRESEKRGGNMYLLNSQEVPGVLCEHEANWRALGRTSIKLGIPEKRSEENSSFRSRGQQRKVGRDGEGKEKRWCKEIAKFS